MTKYLFFAALAALLWSCKSESAPAAEETAATETAQGSVLDSIAYALICKDITQPGDKIKHHDVLAVVDNDTAKVGTIENCEKIPAADYAKYEIPADAFEAVGGTGADKVTFVVYIGKSPEGKITARIGNKYPGKPSGSFDYRSMVVFEEKDVEAGSDINPGAFVGSYVASGKASSHVLYLGFSNRTMVGQLYTLNGALPTQTDSLMIAISKATPEILSDIQVSWSDLSFSSAKGPGKFNRNGDKVQGITFSKWKDGQALTLEKKEIK